MTIETPSPKRTTPIARAIRRVANPESNNPALNFHHELLQGIASAYKPTPISDERAGWSIPQWCKATGVSRSFFYALADDIRPAQIKIQRRRIITEQPAQWLARVGRP